MLKGLRKVKKTLSKSFRKSKSPADVNEPADASSAGEADTQVSGKVSIEASTNDILVEPAIGDGTTPMVEAVESESKEETALLEEAVLIEEETAPIEVKQAPVEGEKH